MARQIVPVERESDKVNTINLQKENSIRLNDEEVIISAGEMQRLFNEWDGEDLSVNPNLAERIRRYLDYQETLDPLRQQLARRIYQNYIIIEDEYTYKEKVSAYTASLIINNRVTVAQINILRVESVKRGVSVTDFKTILMALGDERALWIKEDDKHIVIDIYQYLKTINYNIEITQASYDDDVAYIVSITSDDH